MNKTLRVAKHEFLTTAANKAFVVITILGPIIILAISVLPTLLTSSGVSSAGSVVALVAPGEAVGASLAASLGQVGAKTETVADEAAAESGVLNGRYAAAVVFAPGWEKSPSLPLYVKTGTDIMLYSRIEGVVGQEARDAKARASGLDPKVAAELTRSPSLDMHRLGSGEVKKAAGGEDFVSILLTVLAFVMLLYMTVLLYGQLIGRSVLQEKTSKTVEIMLSSVSTRQLMAGKILGPGLAGLIQYGFWIAIVLGASAVLGPGLGIKTPTVLTPQNLLWLIAFFIPAYFLYASVYAALGAGAEDEQHLAQLAWPLLICLIFPIVLISYFVMNPTSPLSIVLSYFPLTSPIVMLIRVLLAKPAWWEIAASYALLVAAVFGAAIFAAKVFRVGILMTGKRRKLGEILRWVRVR